MRRLRPFLYAAVTASVPCIALANTEPAYLSEPIAPEVLPMGFDQCIEILRNYERDLGPPEVVLDTPALRIVKFTSSGEHEQIACDADGNIMTVLNPDDD